MQTLSTIKDITSELEKGIENLFNSTSYQSYLETMAKFHHYSYRNTLLIWMQKPDATYVAGYKAWMREFNRYVKKGEKGIRIYAPIKAKQLADEEEEIIAYKLTTVFDISQTEGKDLPKGFTKQLLGEMVQDSFYLEAISKICPLPISYTPLQANMNGFYDLKEKKIVINSTISSLQKIKTLIHELTHVLLHTPNTNEKPIDIHTREIEAESVAYTVLKHYGYDTSEYSFGYIADWSKSKDIKEFKNSLNTIVTTANTIITRLDKELLNTTFLSQDIL